MNGQAGRTDHPWVILREAVLPALHLSVSQAARDLCLTRQTLHRILAGDAGITQDVALRLEKLCGVSWQFWLERQHLYELERVTIENREVLPRIPSRRLPAAVMKRLGVRDVG